MSISVMCPNGHRLNVKDSLVGKKFRCPKCQAVTHVPQSQLPLSGQGPIEIDLNELGLLSDGAENPFDFADLELPNSVPVNAGSGLPGIGQPMPGAEPSTLGPAASWTPDVPTMQEGVPRFTRHPVQPAPASKKKSTGSLGLNPGMKLFAVAGAMVSVGMFVLGAIYFAMVVHGIREDIRSRSGADVVNTPLPEAPSDLVTLHAKGDTLAPEDSARLVDAYRDLKVLRTQNGPVITKYLAPEVVVDAAYDPISRRMVVVYLSGSYGLYRLTSERPEAFEALQWGRSDIAACCVALKQIGQDRYFLIGSRNRTLTIQHVERLEEKTQVHLESNGSHLSELQKIYTSLDPSDHQIFFLTRNEKQDPTSRRVGESICHLSRAVIGPKGIGTPVGIEIVGAPAFAADGSRIAAVTLGKSLDKFLVEAPWEDWIRKNPPATHTPFLKTGKNVPTQLTYMNNRLLQGSQVFNGDRDGFQQELGFLPMLELNSPGYVVGFDRYGLLTLATLNDWKPYQKLDLDGQLSENLVRRLTTIDASNSSPTTDDLPVHSRLPGLSYDDRQNRLIVHRYRDLYFVELSPLKLPVQSRPRLAIEGPTEVYAGQEVQFVVNSDSTAASIKLVTRLSELDANGSKNIPLVGRSFSLERPLLETDSVLTGESLQLFSGLPFPTSLLVGEERVVALSEDTPGTITIDRPQPRKHPVGTTVVIDTPTWRRGPRVEGNTIAWTPRYTDCGMHQLAVEVEVGEHREILYLPVNVTLPPMDIGFPVQGIAMHPSKDLAFVWGLAQVLSIRGTPGYTCNAAVLDIGTGKVIAEMQSSERYIRAAYFDDSGVYAAESPISIASRGKSTLTRYHATNLIDLARCELNEAGGRIVGIRNDKLAVVVAGGLYVLFFDAKTLDSLNKGADNRNVDLRFQGDRTARVWEGATWNEQGAIELLLYPYPILEGKHGAAGGKLPWRFSNRLHVLSGDSRPYKNETSRVIEPFGMGEETIFTWLKNDSVYIEDVSREGDSRFGASPEVGLESREPNKSNLEAFPLKFGDWKKYLDWKTSASLTELISNGGKVMKLVGQRDTPTSNFAVQPTSEGVLMAVAGQLFYLREDSGWTLPRPLRIQPRQSQVIIDTDIPTELSYSVEGPSAAGELELAISLGAASARLEPMKISGIVTGQEVRFDIEITRDSEFFKALMVYYGFEVGATDDMRDQAYLRNIKQFGKLYRELFGEDLDAFIIPVSATLKVSNDELKTASVLSHSYFWRITRAQLREATAIDKE